MFKFIRRNRLVDNFNQMVEDNILSKTELETLQKQIKDGDLDEAQLHKLITDHFNYLTREIIERITTSRRMSPDDEAALFKICDDLKVVPNFGKDMIMAKLLWKREHEGVFTLPEIENPNPIKKLGESISFVNEAIWQQVTKKKNYIGYAGLSYKLKIADGLHFRIGNVGPKFTESEGLEVQGHGKIIISNKKILFDGEHKSHSITLGRVIDIEPYSDGIRIAKNTGPDDFFMMDAIASEFAVACLLELLRQ